MRKDGVNILVVGIGQGVNTTELAHIGGGDGNVYSAASFDELIGSDFVNKIKDDSCEAGKFLKDIPCQVSVLHEYE